MENLLNRNGLIAAITAANIEIPDEINTAELRQLFAENRAVVEEIYRNQQN